MKSEMKRMMVWYIMIVIITAQYYSSQGAEVVSKNIVGYTRVDIPPQGKQILVGLNFKDISDVNFMMLNDIFGTNQLRKSNLPLFADKVYYWDKDNQIYIGVYQRNDGYFYTIGGNIKTNFPVYNGEGFWILSPTSSTTTNSIYLKGNVNVMLSSTNEFTQGFCVFTHPYASDINICNINWLAMGATGNNIYSLADKLYVWDVNSQAYIGYYLRADGTWRTIIGNIPVTNITVSLGGGAWYNAKKDFNVEFSRPYNLN